MSETFGTDMSSAFTDAMNASAEEAGVAPDEAVYAEYLPGAAEVAEPETPAERARDEAGRFAATPADEPVVAEETPQEEAERLWAGKYKTPEAAEAAWVEAQKTVGGMASELGQLRALIEQGQNPAAPEQPVYQPQPHEFAALIEQDPGQAAEIALQAGNGAALRAAIDQWKLEAPFEAATWVTGKQREADLAQLREEFKTTVAPAVAGAQQAQLGDAVVTVAGKHEDFAQVVGPLTEDRLVEIVNNGFPKQLLDGLGSGDRQAQEQTLETLYRWVKSEQAGSISEAVAAGNRETQEAAHAERLGAVVASASSNPPDVAPQTESDRMVEVFSGGSDRFHQGWTGRDTRTR